MATANSKVLSPATSKDEALSWLMAGEITVDDYKRWDASKASQGVLRCKVVACSMRPDGSCQRTM